MKAYLFCITILLGLESVAQEYDATWVMGYPNAIYKFDSVSIYRRDSFPLNQSLFFFLSSHTMSDKYGNLIYISDGLQINDRNDSLMEGGNQLLIGIFHDDEGYDFRQSPLSLPMPGSDSLYYIFYETYWDTALAQGSRLYYGIIDMSANAGLGKVVSLNNILIDTFISDAGLSVCRHANGIDWWLVKPKYNSNEYFKFLVKGNGVIEGPHRQSIGLPSKPPDYNGALVFSPIGDKMFYTNGLQKAPLFDFDRCTGVLSNPRYIWGIYDNELVGGESASFSPSGRFLYVTGDTFKLYQVDTYSNNIDSSKITLSHINLASNQWPNYHQLAPNGKIYIEGYNSPTPLTIINYPDSLGFACGLDTFAYDTLAGITLGMPSFPYYRTPPARAYQADAGRDTTICFGDTIRLGVEQVDSVVYLWQSNISLLGNIDIARPLAAPQQTTSYYLTVNDTVPRGYSCNVRTDTIIVTVVPLPCILGISDISGDVAANIRLYPNPANTSTILFYSIPIDQQATLNIYDQLGQLMLQQKLAVAANSETIHTNQLPEGVYTYQVTINNQAIKRDKFVVVR